MKKVKIFQKIYDEFRWRGLVDDEKWCEKMGRRGKIRKV